LSNAGGLYYRRAALTLRKPGSLIPSVKRDRIFPVGIKNTDK